MISNIISASCALSSFSTNSLANSKCCKIARFRQGVAIGHTQTFLKACHCGHPAPPASLSAFLRWRFPSSRSLVCPNKNPHHQEVTETAGGCGSHPPWTEASFLTPRCPPDRKTLRFLTNTLAGASGINGSAVAIRYHPWMSLGFRL